MVLRAIAIVVVFALCASAPASAQEITTPWRDETSRPDAELVAAEAAAISALAAAEAAGATDALAQASLALARIRLERGQRSEAREPAERALALATAHPDSGVDPIAAAITAHRSRLNGADRAERNAFYDVIVAAFERDDLSSDLYLGSIELAMAENADGRFRRASGGWSIATRHAAGAGGVEPYVRARAMIKRAESLAHSTSARAERDVAEDDITAHRLLHEAAILLRPVRNDFEFGDEYSQATRLSAAAQAWHHAIGIRYGRDTPWSAEMFGISASAATRGGPACSYEVAAPEMPQFPRNALGHGLVGTVVVAFRLNAEGEIIAREVIALAPTPSAFLEPVQGVMRSWTITWRRDEPSGCRIPAYIMHPISFGITQR
jgi:hypothetical protein